MSTPANQTPDTSHPTFAPAAQQTRYLTRPEARIGYDVAANGLLVVLVPGMGDLRAGYRFLAPALRAAGYRVARTDLRTEARSSRAFAGRDTPRRSPLPPAPATPPPKPARPTSPPQPWS